MWNCGDYTHGLINTAIFVVPILQNVHEAAIASNVMLNTMAFKDDHEFIYTQVPRTSPACLDLMQVGTHCWSRTTSRGISAVTSRGEMPSMGSLWSPTRVATCDEGSGFEGRAEHMVNASSPIHDGPGYPNYARPKQDPIGQ